MDGTRRTSVRATKNNEQIPLESVFVSIELGSNLAHVAYEGPTGILWDEIPRADGEVLARLGAPTQVVLGQSIHIAGRSA